MPSTRARLEINRCSKHPQNGPKPLRFSQYEDLTIEGQSGVRTYDHFHDFELQGNDDLDEDNVRHVHGKELYKTNVASINVARANNVAIVGAHQEMQKPRLRGSSAMDVPRSGWPIASYVEGWLPSASAQPALQRQTGSDSINGKLTRRTANTSPYPSLRDQTRGAK